MTGRVWQGFTSIHTNIHYIMQPFIIFTSRVHTRATGTASTSILITTSGVILLCHAFTVLSTRGACHHEAACRGCIATPRAPTHPPAPPEGALAPDGACHLPTGLPMTDGPVCVCMTFLWYFIPVYCTARSVLGALEAPATRGPLPRVL